MSEVSVARIGEPKHIAIAAMVMVSAACGTLAPRSFDNTINNPGASMTPVPIKKLPNVNARTYARSALKCALMSGAPNQAPDD